MNDNIPQPMKRKLLALLCGLPWLGACRAGPDPYHTEDLAEDALRQRFRGLSIVLRVDAVAGVEMAGVTITNDEGVQVFGSAAVALHKNSIHAVGSARVPRWVRVIWRKDDKNFQAISKGGVPIEYKGTIIGDYAIPVAGRIPDEVLESLHKDPRGDLRIKFRLHSNGVYFGWDIERRPSYDPNRKDIYFPPGYEMTGGDFKEARVAYFHWGPDGFKRLPAYSPGSPEAEKLIETGSYFRKDILWEKGWYIDKDGRKVLADY